MHLINLSFSRIIACFFDLCVSKVAFLTQKKGHCTFVVKVGLELDQLDRSDFNPQILLIHLANVQKAAFSPVVQTFQWIL